MPLSRESLSEIAHELARRPLHEKVRSQVYRLLVEGLGADSADVDLERPVPEVKGRIDALWSRTVFEFKSDLRRERADAEEQLARYLGQRQQDTGDRFVGIATDGAEFIAYELRDDTLRRIGEYAAKPDEPRELLDWLGAAVVVNDRLEPTPDIVRREFGRGSLAWSITRAEMAALWAELSDHPDVKLKRDLWSRLLERVYGANVDADELFFQHTYLSVIAKTMATHVLGLDAEDATALLNGDRFRQAAVSGAVEADFFNWVLESKAGHELVQRLALQARRFNLSAIKTDVLKGLYESLVDPEQRHDLGEYYTPDWLAEKICDAAITDPLEQRVLDPACGSGTFVFHAVRRLLNAADKAGISNSEAITRACGQVFGIDVHPLAAQVARVTFLLALGEERLAGDRGPVSVPVYLGDSLQWNTGGMLADREVFIDVPASDDGDANGESGEAQRLEFPFEIAGDPALFDSVIDRMLQLSRQEGDPAPAEALLGWLRRQQPLGQSASGVLAQTYEVLRDLHRSGRNHIWGFVARNLVRPVWLSQDGQRADTVVGNPPWLSYRYMARHMKQRFQNECKERNLWAGGRYATHQDLSAYFFARSVELYLKPGGTIAFVMPFAAMTRGQYRGFRSGIFRAERGRGRQAGRAGGAIVQFTGAWAFSDDVQPLFPVPSCVLFAVSGEGETSRLPEVVRSAHGILPRRDAHAGEAGAALSWTEGPWPEAGDESAPASPYRDAFHQGATMVPRMLCVVERGGRSALGGSSEAPLVQSRRTSQEKPPWKNLPSLRGNVEQQFLRPLYLGESIAPFRILSPVECVVPWEEDRQALLNGATAQSAGFLSLAEWMRRAEALWKEHQRSSLSLVGRWDYHGGLRTQFPVPKLRVLYSKAGSLQAACLLDDPESVVDHKLYWLQVQTASEGRYLAAIINSETTRALTEHLQSRGQWGTRDFDKVMLSLPIPRFDAGSDLHKRLAAAGQRAEEVAAQVELREGQHFVTSRRRIRTALYEDGVAKEIDGLVAELLSVAQPSAHNDEPA